MNSCLWRAAHQMDLQTILSRVLVVSYMMILMTSQPSGRSLLQSLTSLMQLWFFRSFCAFRKAGSLVCELCYSEVKPLKYPLNRQNGSHLESFSFVQNHPNSFRLCEFECVRAVSLSLLLLQSKVRRLWAYFLDALSVWG